MCRGLLAHMGAQWRSVARGIQDWGTGGPEFKSRRSDHYVQYLGSRGALWNIRSPGIGEHIKSKPRRVHLSAKLTASPAPSDAR
jgi:hypothetical protein